MKLRTALRLLPGIVLLLGAGCASSPQGGRFVRTVDFTPYRTFEVRPALTTGFEWEHGDAMVVDDLSERVLAASFEERGFERAGAAGTADLFAVAKWRRYSGYRSSIFNPVDPAQGRLEKDRPGGGFAVRYELMLEIYDGRTDTLIWRADLPDVFEAVRFNEQRVTLALQRAIEGFPQRVPHDPNLPSIR